MREVIIACDFKDRSGLDALLKELKGERPYLKIGMEMYYRYGYELVRKLKAEGYKIFLDLYPQLSLLKFSCPRPIL